MSKQYLTTHTVDNAHVTDIFCLAAAPNAVISAGGSSKLHVHSTTEPTNPLVQTIPDAHKLGCHHLAISHDGKTAASVGFGGEVKVWKVSESGEWKADGGVEVKNESAKAKGGAGWAWAIALSENGQYLVSTTFDGRINVWDLLGDRGVPFRQYETGVGDSGHYGLCVDVSRDGSYTASGHTNGAVYVFNNNTGQLRHSLPGLVKPVRAVAFGPVSSQLAAAGDSGIISVYDFDFGEHVANLTGHSAWVTSLDWSDSGAYLLSGSFDGKAKVWSVQKSECVATHSETDKPLWAVRWLRKTGRNEMFCVAGANRSLTFYREATGV